MAHWHSRYGMCVVILKAGSLGTSAGQSLETILGPKPFSALSVDAKLLVLLLGRHEVVTNEAARCALVSV
jgi:hypothetical protein